MNENQLGPEGYMASYDEMTGGDEGTAPEAAPEQAEASSEDVSASNMEQNNTPEQQENDPYAKGRERLGLIKNFFNKAGASFAEKKDAFKAKAGQFFSRLGNQATEAGAAILSADEIAKKRIVEPAAEKYEGFKVQAEFIKMIVLATIEETKQQIKDSIQQKRDQIATNVEGAVDSFNTEVERIGEEIENGFNNIYDAGANFGAQLEAARQRARERVMDAGLVALGMGIYGVQRTQEAFRDMEDAFSKKYQQITNFAESSMKSAWQETVNIKNKFFGKINALRLAWHENRRSAHEGKIEELRAKMGEIADLNAGLEQVLAAREVERSGQYESSPDTSSQTESATDATPNMASAA